MVNDNLFQVNSCTCDTVVISFYNTLHYTAPVTLKTTSTSLGSIQPLNMVYPVS